MPIDLTKENCDVEVRESKLPVVVDFWGPSCGPCMALMPRFLEIAEKYEGKVKFCKVDTSQNKRVAINFKVMSLPTILFWKDGAEVARLGGADATPEGITAKIDAMIQ
jgi:thioredoxin 1